jgi:hypothetical protein
METLTKEQWICWLKTDVNKFNKMRIKTGWCKIDLSKTNFYKANFHRADLRSANLTGATLILTNLAGANLVKTDFHRADLYRANLTGANLVGADLTGANLTGANIRGAVIDYVSWPIWCGGMDVIMDEEQIKELLFIQFRNSRVSNIKIPGISQETIDWLNNSKVVKRHNLTPIEKLNVPLQKKSPERSEITS